MAWAKSIGSGVVCSKRLANVGRLTCGPPHTPAFAVTSSYSPSGNPWWGLPCRVGKIRPHFGDRRSPRNAGVASLPRGVVHPGRQRTTFTHECFPGSSELERQKTAATAKRRELIPSPCEFLPSAAS